MNKLVLLLVMAASSVAQAGLVVSAPPGEVNRATAQEPETDRAIKLDFRIRAVSEGASNWAPMAFVAATDRSRNSEFQVFLVKSKGKRDLTLGHRYVEDGKVIFEKPIFEGVPIFGYISAEISVSADGALTVKSPSLKLSHEYKTNIGEFYSSLAVSGATAEFSTSQ